MPMLIVDDEAFELEVKSLEKVRGVVEQLPTKGRKPGDNNVPSSLRSIIAEESVNGTPAKELSAAFGVSPSSISAYKVGATSTTSYNKPDKELESVINKTRERIHKRASRKLIQALDGITPEKLADSKARELSGIAADMSRVIEKTSPKEDGNKIQNNIIFFSPTQINADNYEVIEG